jgi:hypothetical protein
VEQTDRTRSFGSHPKPPPSTATSSTLPLLYPWIDVEKTISDLKTLLGDRYSDHVIQSAELSVPDGTKLIGEGPSPWENVIEQCVESGLVELDA